VDHLQASIRPATFIGNPLHGFDLFLDLGDQVMSRHAPARMPENVCNRFFPCPFAAITSPGGQADTSRPVQEGRRAGYVKKQMLNVVMCLAFRHNVSLFPGE